MEEIKGYVEHIVYRNEDNGYTVFHLNNSDGEVTCVGSFHYIEEGELLRLKGGYTTHKMYGLQFAVEESKICEPEDLVSIERYLGSGAIKGIGAALAARIVRRFGDDTMRIVEEEPERLAEIKGISEKKAMEIAEQMTEKADMRRYYLSPEIRDITESRRKDLSEIWADCIWSPAGESVSPCRGYQWCGIPYRR